MADRATRMQLKDKSAQADRKVVLASNEYALTLATANALKNRYYKVGLAVLGPCVPPTTPSLAD